ncbi:MAG: T9SS type A sorting domain-containing protein [Saprospiraceae bacterium]
MLKPGRSSSFILFASLLITCFGVSCTQESERAIPLFPSAEEGGDEGTARTDWIERMHTGGQLGSNWRSIERANQSEIRTQLRKKGNLSARGIMPDSLFPGYKGTWAERGSSTQAGSVIATAFDAETESLFTISAGGSFWKGDLDGSSWEVIDQKRRLGGNVLEAIRLADGSLRIITTEDNVPLISGDGGQTWTESTGIPAAVNGWADSRQMVQVERADGLHLYMLSKMGYWENINLYESLDMGMTWQVVLSDVGFQFNDVTLMKPHNYENPMLLSLESNSLMEIKATGIEDLGTTLFDDFTIERIRFAGGASSTDLLLYALAEDNSVLKSLDTGRTWTAGARLTARPWTVGFAVNPSNNQEVIAGAVDAFVSRDAGQSFDKVNGWAEYYRDPETKMHADMMAFNTITDSDGTEVMIISNHGGLYISDNWFGNTYNIGLEGLNVGQFYTVRSHPRFPDHIFGGTQDQGFQRGSGNIGEIIPMEQEISGDYGHLTFTKEGQHLWMVYPGTAVAYWEDPLTGLSDWYEIDSEDESVWLSPVVAHPDPTRNAVLVAGGSAVDNEEGSFVLTFEANGGTVTPQQGNFDFKDESAGGVLSSLATSPQNPDTWYTATDNGRFFRSFDGGTSWEQTVNFVPGGHYLYGQSIEPSPAQDSTLWLAGNGYSNPAVYRSSDAGETFVADAEGLPNTMVFDLTSSDDGSLMFAATEAGPYVYVVDSTRWYSLMNENTPVQTYWSVEWVSADSVARFGTYGRGIWDLQVGQLPTTPDTILVSTNSPLITVAAYPNPVLDQLTITAESPIKSYRVFDPIGRVIAREQFQLSPKPVVSLQTQRWSTGIYRIEVETSEGKGIRSVVKR